VRHDKILLAAAISADSEFKSFGAELGTTSFAARAMTATDNRVQGDPITLANIRHPASYRRDLSGNFVAQDHRRLCRRNRPIHDVDVCAANSDGPHLQQHFIFARTRRRARYVFHPQLYPTAPNKSLHRMHPERY
jgi:hypothetical protein